VLERDQRLLGRIEDVGGGVALAVLERLARLAFA
jgi:hypothetical protein